MTLQTPKPLERLRVTATHRLIDFFSDGVEKGKIQVDPPYQRGDVWSTDQRRALVYSWLRGLPIPAVVLNRPPEDSIADNGPFYIVIDGQQRIVTAALWMAGQLSVPASWFPADQVHTTEDTEDGPYVRYTGLTKTGQLRMTNNAALACVESRLETTAQEAEIYILINGGGTPQTTQDIDNAARVAGQR